MVTLTMVAYSETTRSQVITAPSLVSEEETREPLRFAFSGFSLWLSVEEVRGDVSRAISDMAFQNGLQRIPEPHVTALYGMQNLTAVEALERFGQVKQQITSWPALKPVGVLSDLEFYGVGGGTMDMAWTEISLASSEQHEALIDKLYETFHDGHHRSSRPWKPHLSLAYDNPDDGSILTLSDAMKYVAENPSLVKRPRKVTGISLWSTQGTLAEWKCLDRVIFQDPAV